MKINAVGDVLLDRSDHAQAFEPIQTALSDADVVFGNCEGVYTKKWVRACTSGVPLIVDPAGIDTLAAHFDVMSLANNHALDGGPEAFIKMKETLQKSGIATSGGGENFTEAHNPAIVEREDKKVSFLSYTSVFPKGYEAKKCAAGLAVVRAHSLYTPWELNEWNPGLIPRIKTIPLEQDYEILKRDIQAAKQISDHVIVSFHWGDFTRPFVVTDHERRTARTAIDAGADAIIGHHHHIIRGCEFYQDKPIFYGLGHFVFDLPDLQKKLEQEAYLVGTNPLDEIEMARRFGEYRIAPRANFPMLPFHEDARMTFIASIEFESSGNVLSSLIPCFIHEDNTPRFAQNDELDRFLKYFEKSCSLEQLNNFEIQLEHKKEFPVIKLLPK